MLRRTTPYLADRGCDTPRLDAEVMLAAVLGIERLALYTDHERPLTNAELDRYRDAVSRRGKREPVAYITGQRGFRAIELTVDANVLVPRPETELLVELAVASAPHDGTLLDWGTGSGAIALAMAAERPDLTVTAIDRSEAALAIARANDPAGRVEWIVSDGFEQLAGLRYDVILANPPYLADGELSRLEAELGFEPVGALVAGPTGLEAIERIVTDAPGHLTPGGRLGVEVGVGQADRVAELMGRTGLTDVEIHPDLAGIDRVVTGVVA